MPPSVRKRKLDEFWQALRKGQKVPFSVPAALALARFVALLAVCVPVIKGLLLLLLDSETVEIGVNGEPDFQLKQFLIQTWYCFLILYALGLFMFFYLRYILAADGRDSPWSLGLRALVFACFTVFCLWLLSLTHGRNIFSSRDFLLDLTVCFCVGCWFIPRINALRLKEQAKEKSKETNG